MPVPTDASIEVSQKGDIGARAIETLTQKVGNVADRCRERVDRIEIRLTLEPDPARQRPAIAEATLDVDGKPVRAHVAAETVDEAIDSLVDRLRRRVQRHEERRHRLSERRNTGDSGPGAWRHGDLASARPEYLVVPFDEREVRRTKTFALEPMSVEEAAFDLEILGHEFYLFVDEANGCDSIVRRRSDGAIELITSCPDTPRDPTGVGTVAVGTGSVPHLTLTEAKEHLEAGGGHFLFHMSGDPARGRVLYRRYDGHYGLVTAE
ncbi:MAG: HPF/RaiA family ribosome-associated protein [Acidimicrobiia bacterium]|nr:HPF/RaiA family ribosome-associated protein [Acidimicrobiia bacterium]